MAENSKIQWTDHTFNPWIGCSRVNEGCQNCYAENLMDTRYGRVEWGPEGTRSRTKTWNDPRKWQREARRAGVKFKVFCASLADVFEDFTGPLVTGKNKAVLWRDRRGRYDDAEASGFEPCEIATLDHLRADLFDLIDETPDLYWLLLTKRPENVRKMWPDGKERDNVWLGTSIANQRNADECIDKLLDARFLTPVLFLSLEPQIGFVDLEPWLKPEPLIGWVIVGGESQQRKQARPFHVEWAEDMVQQCRDADVPCFVKQLGSNAFYNRMPFKTGDSHGGDIRQWPAAIQVRECPEHFYAGRETPV